MVQDPLERFTDLLAMLLHTYEPLTFEQIRWKLEETCLDPYLEGESGRRQFERDKADLRDRGIEVTTEYPEGLGGVAAYRIHSDDYYLPDLHLTAEEQVALNLAHAAVRLIGTDWIKTAGWKLGGLEIESTPRVAVAGLGALPGLAEAVSQRAAVRFTYKDRIREVDAWQLLFRERYWYLCGHDHDRDDHRFFRIDRIAPGPVEVAGPWARTPPEDYDAALELPDPWLMGDQPVTAHVAVDPVAEHRVRRELGDPEPAGATTQGWIIVPVEVAHRPSFRSWLLGHLDHVRIEGPPELRDEIVAWLESLAGTP